MELAPPYPPHVPYLVLDPSPTDRRLPFLSAPATTITTAEADAVRQALAANERRLSRIGLALVPLVTGAAAALSWWLFFDVVPAEGETRYGTFHPFAAVALMLAVLVFDFVVVWGLWDEALAVAPGQAPLPPGTPQTVEGVLHPRRGRRQAHWVRFPKRWWAKPGRVRLGVVMPPKRPWSSARLGRTPVVFRVETAARPLPTSRTPRAGWTWDDARLAFVPKAPQPAHAWTLGRSLADDLAEGRPALRYPLT